MSDLAEAAGCPVSTGELSVRTAICFAYRLQNVREGAVYVAAPGVGDGPDRARAAVEHGAVAVLAEMPIAGLPAGTPLLVTGDVEQALQDWAAKVLSSRRLRAAFVAASREEPVMTSFAETLLSQKFRVTRAWDCRTFPGRLAVATALAEMDLSAEVALFDLPIDAVGAVADQAELLTPEVVVLTPPVGPAGGDGLAEIVPALEKAAVVVLDAEDERVSAVHERSCTVIAYGRGQSDLRYCVVAGNANRSSLRFSWGGDTATVTVAMSAPRLLRACAAAVAVGVGFGLGLKEAVAALADVVPPEGHMSLRPASGDFTLVDDTRVLDTWEASDDIEALGEWEITGCRYVAMGAPARWGRESAARLAATVRKSTAGFWGVGDEAAEVVRLLRADGFPAHDCYSTTHLERSLRDALAPGDWVLVSGGAECGLGEMVSRLVGDVGEDGQYAGESTVKPRRPDRPTWIEVDVEALAHNTRLIRETCGVPVMAVLKADAYGHGAERMARVVLANGAESIAAACLSEARALRRAGVTNEILILGYTPPWQAREAVAENVSCALFDWEMAVALSRAARDLGTRAVVHVKVDTGLSRLGLTPEEVPTFLARLRTLNRLEVRGIFTHFGSADAGDLSHTLGQLERFRALLDDLERAELRPPVAHAANTAAAMRLPEARLDMVRTAIGLYGLSPSPEAPLPEGFRPTLSFKTTVAQVKWIPPGNRVGYGRAYETAADTRVAVLPVGYGDGFRRTPRNWGSVLVGGRRCPILGNVCMDQTMVDVTGVPGVAAGDEVVLIGRQGEATITVDEVAANLGTIVYEVVAAILARVPRIV